MPRIAVFDKPVSFTSQFAPCPRCGRRCRRYEERTRPLWSANCHEPVRLVVEFSCFICPNHSAGERWFTALPFDLATNGRYTRSTRSAVIALVVEFKMSFEQAADLARKRFHLLDLDATTIQRWMRADVPDAHTLGSYEREVVARFSGQLAVDELYDDGLAIIKATDPLTGLEIAYKVVEGSVDKAVMIGFFRRLKAMGIEPKVVVTDGAKFYPDAIATVWAEAQHQSCVFHFIKGWLTKAMKAFWSCWRMLPAPKKRGRGRPKKRGRPREDKRKRGHRDLVRRARYLVFKRPERLTDDERTRLQQALDLCPPVRELYRLVTAFYAIFGSDVTDPDTASERRAKLLDDPNFKANEDFAPLLAALADDVLFRRLIVYLDYDNAERTSNHVERENREYRKRQRSHYRLRSIISIRALLDFLLIRPRKTPRSHPPGRQRLRPSATPDNEVPMAA